MMLLGLVLLVLLVWYVRQIRNRVAPGSRRRLQWPPPVWVRWAFALLFAPFILLMLLAIFFGAPQ